MQIHCVRRFNNGCLPLLFEFTLVALPLSFVDIVVARVGMVVATGPLGRQASSHFYSE
jgi:uncharacterized membrane protein YhdT